MSPIEESHVNLIAENTEIHGDLHLSDTTRIHGRISGKLVGLASSRIIVAENGLINGNIEGYLITICGYVKGDIRATESVSIKSGGRVVGNIHAPKLSVEPGGYIEGQCMMKRSVITSTLQPSPV